MNKRVRKARKYFPELNQKFGRMTLIEIIAPEDPYRFTRYRCLCDCGTEKFVTISRLYSGRVVSCGCSTRDRAVVLGKNNRLKEGNSTENSLLSGYKYAAKKRDLAFDLTKEEAHKLFLGDCYYCGIHPSRTAQYETCVESFTFNGIDRVDNALGYTLTNCVSACTTCNKAKNSMSIAEFHEWIKQCYNHIIKNQGNFVL